MSRLPILLLGVLISVALAVPATAAPGGSDATSRAGPRATATRAPHALPIAPPRQMLADLTEADAAFNRFNSSILAGIDEAVAANDDAPLINRLPALHADLAAFDTALKRLRTYRMRNPALERRRAALAVAGPRFAAVLEGFVNAIEARDFAALVMIGDRLETEGQAFDRAAQGTPNVSLGRFLADLGRVNRILDRISGAVRRPTAARMRRARSALVRHRRALDAVITRMRNYRLQDDDLNARRRAAVANSADLKRSLNVAIALSRSKRGVAVGKALQRAVRTYEKQLRRAT